MLSRRLDVLWGQLTGRLLLAGGQGLRYDTNVRDALCIAYVSAVEWMDKEQRTEFDGHVSVTAAQLADFEQDKRERRMQLVMAAGEVSESAGTE